MWLAILSLKILQINEEEWSISPHFGAIVFVIGTKSGPDE